MILADSTIWIDHFRRPDPILVTLVSKLDVLVHPFVVGEVALGHVRSRAVALAAMRRLQQPVIASNDEVLTLIERLGLVASGLGLVDVHLLGSVLVTVDALLWTRDKRLIRAAQAAGVLADLD